MGPGNGTDLLAVGASSRRFSTRRTTVDLDQDRALPHVASQEELDADRAWYPLRNYVMALYMTQFKGRYEDGQLVDFVRRNRAPAVMMWWRDRDMSLSLRENGLQGRRYRRSFTDALEAAGAVPYVRSLRDPVQVQRFWDLGIPVYSDEPFPPLAGAAATATLEAPTFRGADGMPPAWRLAARGAP